MQDIFYTSIILLQNEKQINITINCMHACFCRQERGQQVEIIV